MPDCVERASGVLGLRLVIGDQRGWDVRVEQEAGSRAKARLVDGHVIRAGHRAVHDVGGGTHVEQRTVGG